MTEHFFMLANRYGDCVWETFGSAGISGPVLHTYAQLPPLSKRKRNGVSSNYRKTPNDQAHTESTRRPSNFPLRIP
ncbi:hypothetical protein FPT12_18815 [Pseudomonas sp. H3(2019)]|nr:hypothetical protein FPT12_18815 [Pseudomonas sp. H3(2019)]